MVFRTNLAEERDVARLRPSAERPAAIERAEASYAREEAIVEFLKHAATDLRRLLTDVDHAATTRKAIMPSNPVYGPLPDPERGEPARYLADAVEVLRPNCEVVVMDLVALADAAINADRAVAGLRQENVQLRARVEELERKTGRAERAGRMLSGDPEVDR
ncbi:hypothetical protein ACWEPL_12390 [Nonomuraea sp. NPDC004186]